MQSLKTDPSFHIKWNEDQSTLDRSVDATVNNAVNGAVHYGEHVAKHTPFKKIFAVGVSGGFADFECTETMSNLNLLTIPQTI